MIRSLNLPSLRDLMIAASLFAVAAGLMAQPYQHGPDPSPAVLEATAGPYKVARSKILLPSGYGGGTVYYPDITTESGFGIIAVSPGFVNTEASTGWWGPRLASHGFVVVTINTYTLFDFPGPRREQLLAALEDVIKRSQSSSSVYFGKVDPNRRAVMGHSMGGGGSLEAALKDPALKAVVALQPWDVKDAAVKNFGQITVPTMVITGSKDGVAPPATMGNAFHASLSPSVENALIEFAGGDHFISIKSGDDKYKPLLGKYVVSWMKRFVDNDTRYSPYLCGAQHSQDLASPLITTYKENCPY